MAGLDDLNDDIQKEAGVAPLPGATPPVEVATGYDLVEQSLPDSEHKLLGRWVQRYKLSDDDPMMGQYLTARVAYSSAAACGAAAQAVQEGVSRIPDQIFAGAVNASDEVKGGLVAGGKLFAEAFTQAANSRQAALIAAVDAQQSSILAAATLGADKIKLAATTLTSSLDKSVKAKTDEGVAEFALAAQRAGGKMASTALAAQMSRSVMVMVLAFCLAAMVGAGGLWGWLLITHQIMPTGATAIADPFVQGSAIFLPDGKSAKLPHVPIPSMP